MTDVADALDSVTEESDFEVSQFPEFQFSNKDVREAGKIIAGPLDASDPKLEDAFWAFQVAHNWRDAHAYPLKSVRSQISAYIRTLKLDGITAGRLKRMQAIRRKLRRIGLGLNQLQDLAGCRAVLSSVDEVKILKQALSDRSRHHLRRVDDYIDNPKEKDGYRSCHIIFEYKGEGDASVFDGRRIEVQIRTRLQHSWATAVEAVGLFRGEDLKGNKGDERWLRLFKLMSAEFALVEGCPEFLGVPNQRERIKEIKSLDRDLEATKTLDNLSDAVKWVDDAVTSSDMPIYYLIKYFNKSYNVEVWPYFNPLVATAAYDKAEKETKRFDTTVVLVEASKVNQLREAYPNYFGDVQHFKQNLKRLTQGKSAKDYIISPQERVGIPVSQIIDPRWLRKRGRWN